MQTYFLPSHVHVCKANGHFVFLNLKEDEYSALDREQSDVLEQMMSTQYEVNIRQVVVDQKEGCGLREGLAEELITQGLLTSTNANGKPLAAVSISKATFPLIEVEQCARSAIGATDVWRFYAACIRASYALRVQTIDKIISSTARRKKNRACMTTFDLQIASATLAKFKTLRPFYHRPYLCLFDALALVEFLALYRIYPTWVFGVKSEPFHAHCWVQEAEYVFDEEVDVIQTYSPIMFI